VQPVVSAPTTPSAYATLKFRDLAIRVEKMPIAIEAPALQDEATFTTAYPTIYYNVCKTQGARSLFEALTGAMRA
jgi:hypothetical protein